MKKRIRFIDLFAGIGGFHLAFHDLGAECVLACEKDEYARETYKFNFNEISPKIFNHNNFPDDIQKITNDVSLIPEFDILCAGFPCQPFSQAGYKKGFSESLENRGNMFFQIYQIIKHKKPEAYFLENVRHLRNHNDGKTFTVIRDALEELGYSFHYKVVKASDYGLPQHRPRIFMVGFKNEKTFDSEFSFPEAIPLKMDMSDIFKGNCNKKIGYTLRVGGRGSGLNDRRNWDTYLVNGKVVRISSREGKKMMGFPDSFLFPVSETQAMKQLGNSVAVPAVRATAEKILQYVELSNLDTNRNYYKKAANFG
ncbi:MAG: DNA cytosine methyltransferase [Alphaproteobacteria bacterium]